MVRKKTSAKYRVSEVDLPPPSKTAHHDVKSIGKQPPEDFSSPEVLSLTQPNLLTSDWTSLLLAKECAIGCRPDHEFKSLRTLDYRCCSDKCSVKRTIVKSKSTFIVYETGIHTDDHAPLERSRYPWSTTQVEMLENLYKQDHSGLQTNVTRIINELEDQQLRRGLTRTQVTSWLARKRLTNRIPVEQQSSLYLKELTEAFTILFRKSNLAATGDDMDAPIILKVPHVDHIQIGKSVCEPQPKITRGGSQLSVCIPITTKRLLSNRIKTRSQTLEVIDPESLAKIGEKAIETIPVENRGYCEIDGIANLTYAKFHLLNIGTVCNGHFRPVALALVSGETSFNVTSVLTALDTATKEFFEEDGTAEWVMADSGPAMSKGVSDFVGGGVYGSCFVHLKRDDLPNYRTHIPVEGKKAKFKLVEQMLSGIRHFPPELARKIWPVVSRYWVNTLGLKKMTRVFEKYHILRNSGWTASTFAMYLPTHNQNVENKNRYLKRTILHYLRVNTGKDQIRFPSVPVPLLLETLFI